MHTPVSACASGAEALALALDLLRAGRADVVVAGGAESCVHPLPIAGFAQMRALSTRHDEPAAASRPYDKGRDGFVLGEGAGILVLETEEHARARGARIHGRLAGAGLASDAHHVTAPDPTARAPRGASRSPSGTPTSAQATSGRSTRTRPPLRSAMSPRRPPSPLRSATLARP